MSAVAVLTELAAAGVVFSAEGDRLRYRAPTGTMTADRLRLHREHKAEIIRLLPDADELPVALALAIFDAEPVRSPIAAVEPVRCFACGAERSPDGAACRTCHPAPATRRG